MTSKTENAAMLLNMYCYRLLSAKHLKPIKNYSVPEEQISLNIGLDFFSLNFSGLHTRSVGLLNYRPALSNRAQWRYQVDQSPISKWAK